MRCIKQNNLPTRKGYSTPGRHPSTLSLPPPHLSLSISTSTKTIIMSQVPPDNLVIFGPDANCTLALCPVEWSVYQYRPSLAANITFIVLYAIAMGTHLVLGIKWKQWFYMSFMMIGCLFEIIGYIGRIIMYSNPFNFGGFMVQIVFITSGPVFYTAAIYVTLSKTYVLLSQYHSLADNAVSNILPPRSPASDLSSSGGSSSLPMSSVSSSKLQVAHCQPSVKDPAKLVSTSP